MELGQCGREQARGDLNVPFPSPWKDYGAQTAVKALHAPMSLPSPQLGHPLKGTPRPPLGCQHSKSWLSVSFYLHLKMGVEVCGGIQIQVAYFNRKKAEKKAGDSEFRKNYSSALGIT